MSDQQQDDLRVRLDETDASLSPTPPVIGENTPASPGYGYGYYGGAPSSPTGERHLKDYVKIIYKRRVLVASTFLAVFAASVVYVATAVPRFEARAKLLIEADQPNYLNIKEVYDPMSNRSDYYQTQYDLLKSRALARRTLDHLKLWNTPPFGGGGTAPSEPTGWVSRITGTVKGWFGSTPEPVAAPAVDESLAESAAISRLLGGLQVVPLRGSRIVDLTYQSTDPALAMQLVNAQAKAYVDQSLEFRFLSSKDATNWLGERLAEQREQVSQAELRLQKYREQNNTVGIDSGENIVLQKLTDLNREVTKAKTERLNREAVYDQLRNIQKSPAALDAAPAILSNAFIQQQRAELSTLQRQEADLSQKFDDNYPPLKTLRGQIQTAQIKLTADINKVLQGVENEYNAALAAERNLVAAYESQKKEALSANRTAIEFSVLQREVESARSIYQTFLQRSKETGASSEQRTSNVRIVDLAELPRSPVSPNRQLDLTAGFGGGLVLALFVGFFFEYLDNRFKTPDELKTHLGIPSLGMLPLIRHTDDVYPTITDPKFVKLAEAFRTVRTNVIFSSAEQGSRTLGITSTSPGEGKTVVSSNLGISLAQAGMRVLIIDADMRKPKIHKVFNLEREPGLSNLMVGTAKASQCVRKTDIQNVWVLPAGRTPPNAAELLGSARFREFIGSLSAHFDWIIVDTPPVLAVADASVVGHVVKDMMFVVAAEMASRHAAQSAMEQLGNARIRVIGGVLNRVDLDRNEYYYSQYYRKEYSDYYTTPSS